MSLILQNHGQALEVLETTYLKSQPWQLADLTPSIILPEYLRVDAGTILKCGQLTLIPGAHLGDSDDHYLASLLEPRANAYRWFLYGKHVKAQEAEHPDLVPAEAQKTGNPMEVSGPAFDIPGLKTRVTNRTRLLIDGKESNFNWGEVTKGGKRIPIDSVITDNVLRIAAKLQVLRTRLGTPVMVTSWYRPPEINAAVGGSTRSRHLVGDAVDFYCPSENLIAVFEMMRDDPFFNQGGLAIGDGFIHIDDRDGQARWHYPRGPRVRLW